MSAEAIAALIHARQLMAENSLSQAISLCDSVLANEPANAGALGLKATAFLRLGNQVAALELLEYARRAHPRDAQILRQLGRVRLATGSPREAASALRQALSVAPREAEILIELGSALMALGEFDEATRILHEGMAREETATRAAAGLAYIAEQERRWPDMVRHCQIWCERDPVNPQAWRSLSQAHWEMGDTRRAVENYKESLKRGGASPAHLTSFGRICLYAGDYAQAAEALAKAEGLAPNSPDTMSTLALLHTFLGDFRTAESYARRALTLNPVEVSALRVLIELSNGQLSDVEGEALSVACKRTNIPAQDSASLHFLLGDYLDARQSYDDAFAAYAKANELLLQTTNPDARYNLEGQAGFVAKVIALNEEPPPPTGVSSSDVTPIFIVGMPRSGTTLVESVLAAHPEVHGGGEREEMRRIAWEYYGAPGLQAHADAQKLARWRDDYLRSAPASQHRFLVDKHPWNYDCVGLILQVFPQAKIIHIRRNPVETGLSIFRHEFGNFMTFTCSLDDIGRQYSQYARLVSHWETKYGDRMISLQYEQFVDDFETSARALLAGCGLSWDDRCLEFWRTKRAISTITAVAARKPISRGNGRAAHYAKHLTGLVNELERGGVNLATGKFRG